jgi:hypothetical protein
MESVLVCNILKRVCSLGAQEVLENGVMSEREPGWGRGQSKLNTLGGYLLKEKKKCWIPFCAVK